MNRAQHEHQSYPDQGLSRIASRPNYRPRLLYIITRAERGGAQMHVLELARAMRNDFDVHVAVGDNGFLADSCRQLGIRVHIVPRLQREIQPFSDIAGCLQIFRLLRQLRPDLIHAHTWKSGFLGRLMALFQGIPSVYTVHMWPFGQAFPLTWRIFGPHLERLAARWSRFLITVSESGAEVGRKARIVRPSRIVAIENGIEDSIWRSDLTQRKVPVLAMVARFTSVKDHETLLKAFAGLGVPAKLLLVGDGTTRPAMETMARSLDLGDNVEFAGERGDIAALLSKVDVFVLASKNELLPISIIEAMRAGLPVVASRLGGIPELVVDGLTGSLVEAGSVSELQTALATLVLNCDLRIRLGAAGRRRYEEKFTVATMYEKTMVLYQRILNDKVASTTKQTDIAGATSA